MGYPMNYGRVIGRNRLTGDYDPAEHTGLGLIRGDLRRLEKDQQDDAHVAAYARRAGTTFAQAKQILADVFSAQDVLWQPAPNNPEVAAAPEGGAQFIDAVEKIAFEMTPPNAYTPRLVQLCAEMRLRAQEQWVSVSERLPGIWEDCIVAFDMNGTPVTVHAMLKWDGEHWVIGITDLKYPGVVTHWMPLPKAPPPMNSGRDS